MTKLLASVLAGLLALQTGLPALGLDVQYAAPAALVVGVAVAVISNYLGRTPGGAA